MRKIISDVDGTLFPVTDELYELIECIVENPDEYHRIVSDEIDKEIIAELRKFDRSMA